MQRSEKLPCPFLVPSRRQCGLLGWSPHQPIHRGAFCQSSFRWIYYYGNNKSTGKETSKSHLCAIVCWSKYYFDRLKIRQWVAGLDLGHSTLFIFIFVKLKKKWKDFCKEFCKKLWKKGTWNIRRLVDETIHPATHRIILFLKSKMTRKNKTIKSYNQIM